jgi:hypothetical protein
MPGRAILRINHFLHPQLVMPIDSAVTFTVSPALRQHLIVRLQLSTLRRLVLHSLMTFALPQRQLWTPLVNFDYTVDCTNSTFSLRRRHLPYGNHR